MSTLLPICQILPAPNPVLTGTAYLRDKALMFAKGGLEKRQCFLDFFSQEQPNYISYLIFCNSKCKLEGASSRFYKAVSLLQWYNDDEPCWNNGRLHFITPLFAIFNILQKICETYDIWKNSYIHIWLPKTHWNNCVVVLTMSPLNEF